MLHTYRFDAKHLDLKDRGTCPTRRCEEKDYRARLLNSLNAESLYGDFSSFYNKTARRSRGIPPQYFVSGVRKIFQPQGCPTVYLVEV